jgi:hypothetical protein
MPIWGQYEQYCNGIALKNMGVQVLDPYKALDIATIEWWLDKGSIVMRDYSYSIQQSLSYLQDIASAKVDKNLILQKQIALQ